MTGYFYLDLLFIITLFIAINISMRYRLRRDKDIEKDFKIYAKRVMRFRTAYLCIIFLIYWIFLNKIDIHQRSNEIFMIFSAFICSIATTLSLGDRFIFPKSKLCDKCKLAIFFVTDWKCPHCGHINHSMSILGECEKCSNPMQTVKCPDCGNKIKLGG